MNSWFTAKVKYIKQMDDGTFKRVSEPYLLAAMTFTDAEARIYEELGSLIRGEFITTTIARTDIHDIFHYEDSDVWWKCKIAFENAVEHEDGRKAKKVSQYFLVSAHSIKEAYERLHESLGGLLIDFQIPKIEVSPIVDIFPFGDEQEGKLAERIDSQVKKGVVEHKISSKTVFSASSDEYDDQDEYSSEVPAWRAALELEEGEEIAEPENLGTAEERDLNDDDLF